MKFDLDQATIKLKPGGVIPLRAAAGSTVSVLWGSIWLTQEGDGRDYELRAGESFVVRAGGLTLIDAFDAAAVTILEPWGERARGGPAEEQRTYFESSPVSYISAGESQRYQQQAREMRAMYVERLVARALRTLARTVNRWRQRLASSWEKGARALWRDERNRLWLP
jgi:hypothetical protein